MKQNAKLASTVLLPEYFIRYINTGAPPTFATPFFDDVGLRVLPVGFPFKATFKVGASVARGRDTRRPTEFCGALIKKAHLPVTAFLQAIIILVHYVAYGLLLVEDVQKLRCIACNRAIYGFVFEVCSMGQVNSRFERSSLCAESINILLLFFLDKEEIMHCGLEDLEAGQINLLFLHITNDINVPSTLP